MRSLLLVALPFLSLPERTLAFRPDGRATTCRRYVEGVSVSAIASASVTTSHGDDASAAVKSRSGPSPSGECYYRRVDGPWRPRKELRDLKIHMQRYAAPGKEGHEELRGTEEAEEATPRRAPGGVRLEGEAGPRLVRGLPKTRAGPRARRGGGTEGIGDDPAAGPETRWDGEERDAVRLLRRRRREPQRPPPYNEGREPVR
ncbi:hypothetical protein THAOC_16328, partial [Thalassiosira oceanica]